MPIFDDPVVCREGITIEGEVEIRMRHNGEHWGTVRIGDRISKNGVRIISHLADPPEIVLEAQHGGSLGKVSFARHRDDGNREETVLWQGKINENHRDSLAGEMTVHVRGLPGEGDEGGMVPTETRRSIEVAFHVPTTAAPAPTPEPSSPRPQALYSANGLHWMVMQDDGVFVQYRNRVAFDYDTGEVVFASNRSWPVQP